ncbi:MAG: hypothetical protein L0Z62_21510 [Gemmataceae bacterium]|nr:hypothetical protein [Gemmataceae bacterium]
MSPAEAMEQIESPRFSALVNLASNLRTFLRIVADQPEVQALALAMLTPEGIAAVVGRFTALVAQPGEEGYEHPGDAALAAYLWLLGQRDPEQAERAAVALAGAGRCWWARKVAESVHRESRQGVDGKSGLPEDRTQKQQISGAPPRGGA